MHNQFENLADSPAEVETRLLAPCNGTLRLLGCEDAAGFEALKQALFAEHQPTTPTESILVNNMAESHWLAKRNLRLQDTCTDPETGAVINEKHFSLYMRHHAALTRSFHKSLADLLKLRAAKHRDERGFEAQKLQQQKLEMKKDAHNIDLLRKDIALHVEVCRYTNELLDARLAKPEFDAQFTAELENRGLALEERKVA